MKRILPFLAVLLILPSLVSAAEYTVCSSGCDYTVPQFNGLTGDWGGDAFYFSDTIAAQIKPQIYGSSGSGYVSLDGYEAGDCDPINSLCSSSALLTGGLHVDQGRDYITIQDFRMTGTILQVADYPEHVETTNIIIRRNYLYDMNDRLMILYDTSYVTVEDNKMIGYGRTDDTSGGVYLKESDNVIFRGNEFAGTGSSQCSSDNIFEVHNNDHILWEYNDIHDSYVQSGIAIKEYGNNDIIIRFNKIHDHGSYTDAVGVNIGYNSYNTYVYGNFIYNTYSRGIGIKDGAHDAHIWSNIIVGQGLNGIYSWFESGRVPGDPHVGDIFIFNNIIARNGGAQTDWTGMNHHDGELHVKNNIFWNNRPGASSYSQIYASGDDAFQALEHNTYYHSGGTANFYYDSGYRSLATMQSTYNFEDDSPQGAIRDPQFNNPSANDFSLKDTSPEINNGVNLEQCFDVPVQGTNYHICTSEALHPSTDWTKFPSPSTIIAANQSDYGSGWERGAYVYTEGVSQTCESQGHDCCSSCQSGTEDYPSLGGCSSGLLCCDSCSTLQQCPEGQIIPTCLCGGTERSSGYCCGNAWQDTECSVPTVIPKNNWILVYADSEELVGEDGAATNAFDGDPNTFWHTQWYVLPYTPLPHEIQIDLGGLHNISGFGCLPRQDSYENGMIKGYEFFVSQDGSDWGMPASSGELGPLKTQTNLSFTPRAGQFIRLVALSELNNNNWTSLAELDVYQVPLSSCQSQYCSPGEFHRADTTEPFGCIDESEVLAFIDLWYLDSTEYPMGELMEAVGLWKAGFGCPSS